jgi:hypothetical protein
MADDHEDPAIATERQAREVARNAARSAEEVLRVRREMAAEQASLQARMTHIEATQRTAEDAARLAAVSTPAVAATGVPPSPSVPAESSIAVQTQGVLRAASKGRTRHFTLETGGSDVQTLLIAVSAQLAVYPDLREGWWLIAKTRFDATPVVLDAEVDGGLHQLLLVHCAGKAQDIAIRYDSLVHHSGVSSAVLAIRAMSSHTEPATHAHLLASFTRLVSGPFIGAGVSPDLAVMEMQTALQRFAARFGVLVPEWMTAIAVLKRFDHAVYGTVLEEMGSVATRSGLDISLLVDKLQARFMATKGRSTTVAMVSVEAHAVQLAAQQRVQRMAERSHTDAMKPTLPGGGARGDDKLNNQVCVKCGAKFKAYKVLKYCKSCSQEYRRTEVSANLATVTVDDRDESFYPYSQSLELSGFAVTVDVHPGGPPTSPLLAVCGVDGSLGEDAMPVMHADAAVLCDTEPGVVQALCVLPVFNYESWTMPVLNVPTFHDDSVYTGTHHDYSADTLSLPDTISGGVPLSMLNCPTFPVLGKPTLHDDGAHTPLLPGAVSDGVPFFISDDIHHDYGANALMLPGTVIDGVPPLYTASEDAGVQVAPVVCTQVAPVARTQVAPVARAQDAPVACAQVAPVVCTQVAPVACAQVAPVACTQVAPVARAQVAPVARTQVAVDALQHAAVGAAGADTAAPAFDLTEEDYAHLGLGGDDEPCAADLVPQDAASSYLATFSLADLDVPGPLARGHIVDTKPPPVWLAELPPSPPASLYHDDVLVVHGEAGVFPSAAAVVPADTGGDLAPLPSPSAAHLSA